MTRRRSRERAVWALGLRGGRASHLRRSSRGWPTIDVQASASRPPGRSASEVTPGAVEVLIAAADYDPEPAVRDMARWSLAMLDTGLDTPIDTTPSGATLRRSRRRSPQSDSDRPLRRITKTVLKTGAGMGRRDV